jgi:hypothetical protein
MSRMSLLGLRSGIAVAVASVGLMACSEGPQVTVYEQGRYQGKADTQPWDGPAFNGDREAWEKATKQRARNQSEYNRIQ